MRRRTIKKLRPAAVLVALAIVGCSEETRCRFGDATACGVVGDRVYHGAMTPADLERACTLYRKSCDGGNDVACANLGALIGQKKCAGTGSELLAVLGRACDHGNALACNNLGMAYKDGALGIPANPDRAVANFRRACPRSPAACDNLGALLLGRGEEAAATEAFETGCDAGGAESQRCCFKYGLALNEGWGVPVDSKRGAALFQRTCASGVADACYYVGLPELTAGTPTSLVRALSHFRTACDGGYAQACNNLGLMYATGTGVSRDAAIAISYLQKGCDGGELRACANLGSRYESGDGVARDPDRARALLDRACTGGVAEACSRPMRESAGSPTSSARVRP